jgi:hypothetical protein
MGRIRRWIHNIIVTVAFLIMLGAVAAVIYYFAAYTRVKSREYRGHTYIVFKEGGRSSVVHDPDCSKCRQPWENDDDPRHSDR